MSTKLKLISWQIIRNIIPAFVYRKEKHSFVSGTVPVQEHTETHSVTRGTRDRERPRTLEHMGFRISHAGYAISRPAPSYIAMGRERERGEREGGSNLAHFLPYFMCICVSRLSDLLPRLDVVSKWVSGRNDFDETVFVEDSLKDITCRFVIMRKHTVR